MGHKRDRNKVEAEIVVNEKDRMLAELNKAGFNTTMFSEFELAALVQMGALKNEVVDAIDELGAMLEDYLSPEEN